MVEVAIAILVFVVALTLLSVGVIFRKRTPLKGSCGGPHGGKSGESPDGGMCDACTCGNLSSEKRRRDNHGR